MAEWVVQRLDDRLDVLTSRLAVHILMAHLLEGAVQRWQLVGRVGSSVRKSLELGVLGLRGGILRYATEWAQETTVARIPHRCVLGC